MTLFEEKAPKIMGDLMVDFALDLNSAAAILGNIGHECGGFKLLQEQKPLGGGRGGFGWAQWTGPRRRLYEDYCVRNRLDPAGDKANYAYLFLELSGSYKGAIAATKAAETLRGKVIAFESHFEYAGVKAYDSRMSWAEKALIAYRDWVKDRPIVPPQPATHDQPTMPMDPPTLAPPNSEYTFPAVITFEPDKPPPAGDGLGEPDQTEQPASTAGFFMAALVMGCLVVLAIAKLFHLI